MSAPKNMNSEREEHPHAQLPVVDTGALVLVVVWLGVGDVRHQASSPSIVRVQGVMAVVVDFLERLDAPADEGSDHEEGAQQQERDAERVGRGR